MATHEQIVDIDVSQEMRTSFLEYSYSVIYARALPDARDGLKPVQRRILFQMDRMGLRPDKGHVKSSRVIGDVMGRLHPHGDAAIYDAMVRLSQPFTMRLPMVDGHGNFGSLDDGPAAPRYTEVRMAPAALAMTASLDEDVVDMVPNYDNTYMQPEVLPAAIPNLLVNGSSGIAVGMATNMAPHNLGEVIAGARFLLDNPDASLDELMRYIPGPDLPEGGKIVGLDGVRQAYETGRGTFRTRASAHIENISPRKKGIIFTELPYMVGPEKVIDKIKDGVQNKKLLGISGVQNLTDRKHGTRLVVEVKNSFNPEAVLADLYKHTPLEDSFGINNVALVEGQPRTLGLKELLDVFLRHRLSVTRRRTAFRLQKAKDRLHLVEGLLIAILDIDEVIAVIRSCDDSAIAKDRLMKVFDLTEIQAEFILELRLRRLTKFSQIELETERGQLRREIDELTQIMNSDERLRALVSHELAQTAQQFSTPRRTVLLESDITTSTARVALKVEDDPCWVLLSGDGLIARVVTDTEPARTGPRTPHDSIMAKVKTTNLSSVGVITSDGSVNRLNVVDIPAIPETETAPSLSGGAPLKEILLAGKDSSVVGLINLDEPPVLVLATAQGKIKRVNPDYPDKGAIDVIKLADGDQVVGAQSGTDDDEIVLVTSNAQLLRFPASEVRPQGRSGQGIAGIRLAEGARVIALGVVPHNDMAAHAVVTIAGSSNSLPGTAPGSAKVTPLDRYPGKGRGTGGVRTQRFLRGEDQLHMAWIGQLPARAISERGKPVNLPDVDERRDGSGTQLSAVVVAIG
ncbi:DNA gyrase/topoisomerase IV subunit A [Trueperella pyogenes]|uniref:DNA gyrase/topoisomerase IV subunit A n=1 Tax=Trueperella pyogenes TaxID=1661 RepID=UPI00046A5D85|nr:DNA topoisomerase IV subunit A [Trueperella pyogenes]AZR03375.1 DNA topoisomerase IV subunit A [Trueperella pyogenes]WHU59348.1 DNA topoisomerase IV subunit A [Trueperella pyogenes]WHU61336.1 DNA topoisomerase IV subunit A [Trueperella pyogenes]